LTGGVLLIMVMSAEGLSRSMIVATAVLLSAMTVSAQEESSSRGAMRGLFGVSRVRLLTLEPVQQQLSLSADKKQVIRGISDRFNEQRRQIVEDTGNQGDFRVLREKLEALRKTAVAELRAELDEQQQQRFTQLFLQVNGPLALLDEEVAKLLELSAEQRQQLAETQQKNYQAMRDAFQDFQKMSAEERQATYEKLRSEGEERLLAPLHDQQKQWMRERAGDEFKLDPAVLNR
jgi:hypothetical protein